MPNIDLYDEVQRFQLALNSTQLGIHTIIY